MSELSIAPHLQRALEAMSKDMALEPQAIVNQAVFAWLRINGYVLPGVAGVSEPAAAPAPVAVVAPEPAVRSLTPAPAPVVPVPVTVPVAPAPVVASTPSPVPAVPGVDLAPVLARMAAIDSDLAKLTKPWPAWAPVQEEEEEEEEAPPADEEQEPRQEEEEEEAQPPPPEQEEEEISEKIPAAAAPPEEEEEEEPAPEPNTGETDLQDNEGESTIVLRAAPISLYLEREGEEPVKVTGDRFIIGRGPHCDLVIDSPRVSREHVALTRKGVIYYLEDLNSSNGTWFGEERISRRELESGDVISLGNEPVTFVLRAE